VLATPRLTATAAATNDLRRVRLDIDEFLKVKSVYKKWE
jgi:hypothetical protein